MTLKLNMRTPVGTFLIEGTTQLEVFKQIANIQEVFSETACGLCGEENIRYKVREVQGNEFPELHCLNPKCLGRLTFGQNKGQKLGSIYPKRKLTRDGKPDTKNGSFGGHLGWTQYKGDGDED